MKIIGVDLHTRQQTIAMLDDQTGELVEKELQHEGEEVRRFYSALPKPVLVVWKPRAPCIGSCDFSKSSISSTASVMDYAARRN
jgi:hypothetical protein